MNIKDKIKKENLFNAAITRFETTVLVKLT